ncbi:DUF84 family protein [Candidatus Bipolaricaulota bacterium]|nr:DUF84 family protein [Candidatus Bipolaricaulota bacterium]
MSKEAVPVGEKEIIELALKRAAVALGSEPDGDMGVGFSEGVIQTEFGLFTSAWCAVVTPSGECGLGGGLNVQVPGPLMKKFKEDGLLESEIESFLQDSLQNPYESLVKRALLALQDQNRGGNTCRSRAGPTTGFSDAGSAPVR